MVRGDCAGASPPWLSTVAEDAGIVTLGRKAGTKRGRRQFSILRQSRSPIGLLVLCAFVNSTPPRALLAGKISLSSYANHLRRAMARLGLTPTPGSEKEDIVQELAGHMDAGES